MQGTFSIAARYFRKDVRGKRIVHNREVPGVRFQEECTEMVGNEGVIAA